MISYSFFFSPITGHCTFFLVSTSTSLLPTDSEDQGMDLPHKDQHTCLKQTILIFFKLTSLQCPLKGCLNLMKLLLKSYPTLSQTNISIYFLPPSVIFLNSSLATNSVQWLGIRINGPRCVSPFR